LTIEDRETIRRLTEEEWTQGAVARDWDRLLAMCAEDIAYMPADQPIVHGHAALRNWLEQFPPILRLTQPLVALEGHGIFAIARGTFEVTVDVGGQRIENTGKVLGWFQKDSSGRWLVKAVCWNWDRPLTPAP
jgi:ketosteroid isomerase-like protein